MNVSMNPNYMDDLNGSDYVCMTRSTPQAVSKLAALNPANMNANVAKSVSTPPSDSVSMKLTSKNLQTLQHEQLNSTESPPPSPYAANDNDRASSVASSQLSNNSSTKRTFYSSHFHKKKSFFFVCCDTFFHSF